MDWSNEAVIEFIELLQTEPAIWNLKNRNRKNRNYVNDAWLRIKKKFSVSLSVDELKRKRNSLLAQYRENLKKIKVSTKTFPDEIFKPTWFAFEALHCYLGPVYDCHWVFSNEERLESSYERRLSDESDSNSLIHSNTEKIELHKSIHQSTDTESDFSVAPKRRRKNQNVLIAKKQADAGFSRNRGRSKGNTEEVNECDLYSQLLAKKLKSLPTVRRLILMNEIDNLVFKYMMKTREGKNPHNKFDDQDPLPVEFQHMHLPRSSQSEESPNSSQEFIILPGESKTAIHTPREKSKVHTAVSQQPNYLINSNTEHDYTVPSSITHKPHKKPEGPRKTNKRIKIISETVVPLVHSKVNVIKHEYEKGVDSDTN